MASKAQNQQILEYLAKGKSLTSYEAQELFGCARLAARVLELRGQGYRIESEVLEVQRRGGEVARVALYFLPENGGNNDREI